MTRNSQSQLSIRWQYFMSLYGVHLEYPARRFDTAFTQCMHIERQIHRSQFMHTALPYAKRIMLVVDYGWCGRVVE
jgi:hypothetical protein